MPLERVAIDKSPHYPGEIRYFSSLILPSLWLPPEGQAISRVTYSKLLPVYINTQQARVTLNSNTMICSDSSLFAIGCLIVGSGVPAGTRVIAKSGTSVTMSAVATATTTIQNYTFHLHGLGDGSTTFNLPDYRGRTLIDDGQLAGGTIRYLGQTGGAETHQLTINEIPNHSHGLPNGRQDQAFSAPNGVQTNQSTYDFTPQSTGVGGGQAHNNMMPFGVVQLGVFTG